MIKQLIAWFWRVIAESCKSARWVVLSYKTYGMSSHYCHCYDDFFWIYRNVSVSGLFSLENAALFLDSKKQKRNNRGRFRNVSGIWYGTLKLLIIFAWSLTLKFYVYSIETPMHLYTKVQPFRVLANGMF